MTTDFFDRQDHARRLTRRLLIMFALAVAVIILTIYLLLVLGSNYRPDRFVDHLTDLTPGRRPGPNLWDPALFLGVTLGTIVVVSLGSWYKIAELAGGGPTVALLVGGRALDPQTRDLAERRLLNVVEEMALASGIPVPPVYVLDHEPGINAFAAGYRPGDAVVTVSAGCLRYLTREELQGVIGHELSHILNGDMRLNLRLVGLVFGILVLAVIGYYIMRSVSLVSSRDSKSGGGAAAVFLLGLVLLVLGYLGVFLGNIIKCAISRQRETLADASAVQFTRNTAGLCGALKKIGGLEEGSRVLDAHAAEFSHMFFADAFAGAFFNLFATHPPLIDRIRALEPDFDGKYPQVTPVAIGTDEAAAPQSRPTLRQIPIVGGAVPGGAALGGAALGGAALGGAAPVVAMAVSVGNVAGRIGAPQSEHLDHAARTIDALPPDLLDSAREPASAQAVIYALLLSRDNEAVRAQQFYLLKEQIEPPTYQETQKLAASVQSLSAASRLPLVDLAVPALKKSSPQQYARFRHTVDALVKADGKVDLFEYSLRTMLLSYLDVYFGLKKPPAIRYRTIEAVAQPATVVLSVLAYADQARPADAEPDFQAGARPLLGQVAILPPQQCTLRTFDAALSELAQASPEVKRAVIEAIAACIAAAGKMTLEESELLRVVAAVLACPIPPLHLHPAVSAAGPESAGDSATAVEAG